MRIREDDGDRLVLAGPPGGRGTVALMLVVGVALGLGAAGFAIVIWPDEGPWAALPPAVVSACGVAILIWGVLTALTTDRLELDRVTGSGRWTRRRLGRTVARPIEFPLARIHRIRLHRFVDAAPTGRGGSSEKVRAVLAIKGVRRRIVLDEAEVQRESRVRAVADRVGRLVGVSVQDRG